ncbi:MAG: LysR family transcriptional regulator [Bradyrhizobium sp.]|nr:LysR family transcriptional regulator [Bradyrhizobium sp.]
MRGSLVPSALRYVDQVARSGSIQRAAKELNIAASAVNRHILLLERELGVALFERVARGMRLTSAGDTVVTLARRWRSDERRAAAELKALQGIDQGHVRLAAMDSHVNGFLPRIIEKLAREHPSVSLEVQIASTDDAVAWLLGGSADLAAIFNLSPHRDVRVLWSGDLPFGCIVAPGHVLARQKTVSMQQVAAHPIALQSKALLIRRYLDARHGWLFADSQKMVETNSLQLVKALAKSGRYVAFTSELDAAPEILDGSLIFLPVRDKGAEPQTVSIAIDGRKPLSKIAKLVADEITGGIVDDLKSVRRTRTAG